MVPAEESDESRGGKLRETEMEKKDRSAEKKQNCEKDLSGVVSRIKGKSGLERRSAKETSVSFDEKKSLGLGSSGSGRVSRKQEELEAKMRRGPTLVEPSPARPAKESRPKGRTIRKAHYDPQEVGGNLPDNLLHLKKCFAKI